MKAYEWLNRNFATIMLVIILSLLVAIPTVALGAVAGTIVAIAIAGGLGFGWHDFSQHRTLTNAMDLSGHEAEKARLAEQEQRRLAAAEAAARADEERERTKAEAVNEFLNNDLLASVAPEEEGFDVSMREVLDRASKEIEERFEGQPVVDASTRRTLGNTYASLGEYEAAGRHLAAALERCR